MITEEQFKDYIGQLSESYEKIKDHITLSDAAFEEKIDALGELSNFRDIACTALRNSHINKQFKDN